MATPLQSPAAWIRFLVTAAIGTTLDLWTKSLTFTNLQGQSYRLIPGWIEFEAVINHGAVFGSLQGFRLLFVAVSIGAIAFLFFLFATSAGRAFYQILLGMLLAGVVGNLYDRITFGYVRDMIHTLSRWPHLFPYVFNVADTFLCVGVSLMILYSLLPAGKTPAPKPAEKLS